MPFRQTEEGWEYDPKGKGRIPSKKDLFENIPPVRDAATGHPIGEDGKIDWKKAIEEKNNE